MPCANLSIGFIRKVAFATGCLLLIFCPQTSKADVSEFFDSYAGPTTGEFGWDEFGTTGASYVGPHNPDQGSVGTGSGILTSNGGGLISGTNNLYSFFSVPEWTVSLSGLDNAEGFSTIAFQVATSASYDATQFSLDGLAPDEFIDLGSRTEIGGFAYNFYWVEWQGVTSATDHSIVVNGTGQHQSLAGVKTTYVNSASPTNLTAVPEPVSSSLAIGVVGLLVGRRRRRD